ncbi:MAG: metallophosphoesterase [Methylacidiphilales bacterium]|nr:metallophosphoesterase [Candidatus Methylacidiphilales bacterium]
MSRCSVSPRGPDARPRYSRRHFLRQILGTGALAAAGLDPLFTQTVAPSRAGSFRFAFVTDMHLLQGGALRSVEGIAACLAAVEKLDPRPDFILAGGDLVHSLRELTLPGAETAFDFFLQLWKDHTGLPTHWTFGNHDLAGTSNPYAPAGDKDYGKGLFQDRLQMPRLFYSFDCKGWHFVVLDDIALRPDHNYYGKLFDDELAFLKADLDAHRTTPTIVCTHIPIASNLPLGLLLAHGMNGNHKPASKSLVCTNGDAVLEDLPRHNIRAVLAGHLHFQEEIDRNGVRLINCGAVCGSYWKGPNFGCPEGFGVVDLGADGSVAFDYRSYGWKAS